MMIGLNDFALSYDYGVHLQPLNPNSLRIKIGKATNQIEAD